MKVEQRRIRTAVVGVGAMGEGHCKSMRDKVPEMELVSVADAHVETANRVGHEFGVPAYADVKTMLAREKPEAVLVAVPHPLHAEAVVPCLEAGAHVLCEKPLAECVSAADRMLRAARENRRTLGVMFQSRFMPMFAAAIAFARSGRLGRLLRTLLILPDFRTQRYFDSNPWRATWKGEGGGVLVNQAPHLLDIFVQLTGLPTAVRGRVETRFHDIEVEDHAHAMLRYADGGCGLLYCSTTEPEHAKMIEVVGERGMLTYRQGRMECFTFERDLREFAQTSAEVWGRPGVQPVDLEAADEPSGTFSVMGNFARHILHGEPLKCDAESALSSLEIANAIMLSSCADREVTLPVPRAEYDALLGRLRAESRIVKKVVSHERVADPRVK